MQSQTKGNALVRIVLTGIGITVLFLLVGTVLDYIVTQALSQFVIAECSEDCYFRIFNLIFALVVLVSLAAGIRSGIRTYRRLSK
jgi:succinate dehydrogenase/fumarate reductase cytochrome b subunit